MFNENNLSLEDLIKKMAGNDPYWQTILRKFFDEVTNKSENEKAEFLNRMLKNNKLTDEFLKDINIGGEANALFDKYNVSEPGTLRKYNVDENGHMYEEEVKISFPNPMDKAKIYMGVCKLLDITMPELSANTKRINESNATYYYNLERGGKQLIVADDGSYLLAGSAINYDQLLYEFNNGKRNGNFMDNIECSHNWVLTDKLPNISREWIRLPDGSKKEVYYHIYRCTKCNEEKKMSEDEFFTNNNTSDQDSISNSSLKRADLILINDEFKDSIKQYDSFDIPNDLYLNYFAKLEKIFADHTFAYDNRFVTYGRLDFLRSELTQRLNDETLKIKKPNFVNQWDNRLGAYFDLSDYIIGDRHINIASVPNGMNFHEILQQNDEYYKDGIICEQEKEILIEMINEIKNAINMA